jgi:hypothetical protein
MEPNDSPKSKQRTRPIKEEDLAKAVDTMRKERNQIIAYWEFVAKEIAEFNEDVRRRRR